MISIRQILEYMESGQSFSLQVVSYDRKRKKGGQVLEYIEAILLQNVPDEELTPNPGRGLSNVEQQKIKLAKTPSHNKWYTRNIRILQDGHPTSLVKKIHPPLIIQFNGLKVVP